MKNNFKSPKGQYSRPQRASNSSNQGNQGNQWNREKNYDSSDRGSQPKRYNQSNQSNQSYRPKKSYGTREDGKPNYSSDNRDNRNSRPNYSDKKPFNKFEKSNNYKKDNQSNQSYRPKKSYGTREDGKPNYSSDSRDNRNSRPNYSDKKPYNKFEKSNTYKKDNQSNQSYRPKKSYGTREDGKPNYFSGNRDNRDNRDRPNYSDKKPFNKFEKSNTYKKDNNTNRNNKFNKTHSNPIKNKTDNPFRERYIDAVDFEENKKSVMANDMQENSSMTFGRNAVIELLKSDITIDKIFLQTNQREGSITKIAAEAIRKSIPVIEVEKSKLDKMINSSSHQGVIALTSEIEYSSVDDILALAEEKNEKPFILIADKIMDTQNLGAIIRTAECVGAHGIIIPKRHAAGVSSVVNKISAGAVFHIKIAKVANIASTIEVLKEQGVWVFASTSSDSEDVEDKKINNYYDTDYDLPLCLVVGNEGEGLSPIILQKSDFLVNIPMYGKIESLNVSCATAILLYEIKKQRLTINSSESES